MKNARILVLIGNIILTLEAAWMLFASVLNVTTKLLGANFGDSSANIPVLIAFIVITVLSWIAMNRLAEQNWRIFILIAAILLVFLAWGSLLVGILFIIAFVLANKAAKQS